MFVTADDRVVGLHEGIARYTVGQGKRLGEAAILDGQRQVVIATEPARRRIVVGPRGYRDPLGTATGGELADSRTRRRSALHGEVAGTRGAAWRDGADRGGYDHSDFG